MRSWVGIALLGAALAWGAAACSSDAKPALPRFDLANWDGRRITPEVLAGGRAVLAFSYAKCGARCPMITAQLQQLDEELGKPADVKYVHISVNPAWDTPEEIRKYFADHGIDPERDPRWMFLSGSEAEVAPVLSRFGIAVTRTPAGNDMIIQHTIKVLALNRDGDRITAFDTYFWDEKEMRDALGS